MRPDGGDSADAIWDDPFQRHDFLGRDHRRNERRLLLVIALTLVTMVVEIVAGHAFGSMALLADGWHMATHAGALSVGAVAYAYARRRVADERFVFGTGKVGDLAGFTSAILLGAVALWIAWESAMRFFEPTAIRFDEALVVAIIGFAVNLVSAVLLHPGGAEHATHHAHHAHAHAHAHAHTHTHTHTHEHAHAHGHGDAHEHGTGHAARHHDHNLRGAYLHVLADALTSLVAIGALLLGRAYGWTFLDPLGGLLGALVIARWSALLLRDTSGVLLDLEKDPALSREVRQRLERDGDRVVDLHVWRVGPGHYAAIASILARAPQAPAHYKARLADVAGLTHVTVEVSRTP
jgi:cation diffusion facilitator family transporter